MTNTQHTEMIRHAVVIGALAFLPSQWAVFAALCIYILGVGYRYKEQNAIQEEQTLLRKEHAKGSWSQILGVNEDASIDHCVYVKKLLTEIYHPEYGKAPNPAMMERIEKAYQARIALDAQTREDDSSTEEKGQENELQTKQEDSVLLH